MSNRPTIAESLGIEKAGDERLRLLGEAAYMWMYLGNYDQAACIFEGLTVLAPSDPAGHLGLSEVHLKKGRYKDAQKHVDRALQCRYADRHTTAYAYIVRGQALIGRNKPREAAKAWKKAEKLDPQSAEAEMARCWQQTAAEHDNQLDRSERSL